MGKRNKKRLRKAPSHAGNVRIPKSVEPASTGVPANLKFVLGSAALVIIVLLSFLLLSNRPKIGKAVTNDAKAGTNKLVDAFGAAAPTNGRDRTTILFIPPAATNSVTPGGESELATQYFNQATQKLEQGKLDEAIELYKNALELHQEDEDIYYNLGIAYARKGNAEEAEKYYLEALRIVPDYAEAHNNLGNVLVGQSRFEEANQHFESALKALPEYASAHNNYGTALRLQGKPAEALEHFSAAVRFSTDYVEAHFNLGNVLLSLDRVDEAIKEFTEVLRLRPDFPPAVQRLAQAREKQTAGSPDK